MFASDWLGSTKRAVMSLEEQGAYMNLLAHQWGDDQCCLPDDDEVLAALSELRGRWVKGTTNPLRRCFPPHPTKEGFVANPKLLELWANKEEQRRRSSEGGKKSAQLRREAKGTPSTLDPPLQDPSCETPNQKATTTSRAITRATPETIATPSATKKRRSYRYEDDDLSFAKELRTAIESRIPNPKPYDPENWANEIRLTREVDKHPIQNQRDVFQWANGHDFWGGVIESPKSLRRNFDKISLQMTRSKDNGKPNTPERRPGRVGQNTCTDEFDA